jgi:NEDD8-activating enzyme E1 regulatory subunit
VELAEMLADSPAFTLILYTSPISKVDLEVIESYGREKKTPVISIHSAGFYSYFRISLPGTFPIVDTHPEAERLVDLRLLKPWPELVKFARDMTKDMEELDDHEHGHVPYVVLLLHYLEKWREAHNDALPIKYKEKLAFRQFVSEGARRDNPEGGEENFDEAVAAVNRNIKPPSLEPSLREVFDHKPTSEVRSWPQLI